MTDTQVQALTTVTQAITPAEFQNAHKELLKFVKSELKETNTGENGDYGVIPYTHKKSLLKPGAEKLAKLFGLVPTYEKISEVEDWNNKFVFYKYRCTLTHFATGKKVGDAIRSCNNKEKKHANKIVFDVANTIEAVAQKRALVAAVVMATNASDIFEADTNGDFAETAPNKPTTREEDPRRNQLQMRLYGVAKQHGWTDEWIHKAILKKWTVDSVTKISNTQMEELTEFIVTKYTEVAAGNRPQLRTETISKPELVQPDNEVAVEGEIVEKKPATDSLPEVIETKEPAVSKPIEYFCKGKKHTPETQVKTTEDEPWCTKECEDSYFGPIKKNARMEEFIKTGKLPPVHPPVSMG